MSCWWACMAMILEYYGRNYTYPWDFRERFARPWNEPVTGRPRVRMPTATEAMRQDDTLRRSQELSFNEPYEWYEYGLPRNRRAFELLSEITGFRGFDRPAFGAWTAADVENRLRAYGPYLFCGFWNGFPHAILVMGIIQRGSDTEVVTIDPAVGFATPVGLDDFNRRMDERMREFNFNRLNPMYMPNAEPVRATVNQNS